MDYNDFARGSTPVLVARIREPRTRSALTLVELLVILVIVVLVLALLSPLSRLGHRGAREAARRNQCLNNLKQIAIALQNYELAHGTLPPAYTTDANGKPLHSWRTLILPFMEEQTLYETIDLTKPWDDPVNAKACAVCLHCFQCPSNRDEDNLTTYLAVVTPDSCIRATEPRKLDEITDGEKNTLMVIEVDSKHAVPWMSPQDANEEIVMGKREDHVGAPHPNGMNAAYVDGHVDAIADECDPEIRRALISAAGNDNSALEGK
jgi:prepilin-type processing-associated H-X9-DG protein